MVESSLGSIAPAPVDKAQMSMRLRLASQINRINQTRRRRPYAHILYLFLKISGCQNKRGGQLQGASIENVLILGGISLFLDGGRCEKNWYRMIDERNRCRIVGESSECKIVSENSWC